MAEIIKKHKDAVFAVGIALLLVIGGLLVVSGMTIFPESAVAASNATPIAVTATVSEWLSFSINAVTATLVPNLVDAAGNTAIGSSTAITLTIGTNATGGWSVALTGANNALKNTADAGVTSIASIADAATTTIIAGSDNYGAGAATSAAGVVLGTYYGGVALAIGSIRTGGQQFLSKTSANGKIAVGTIRIYAACTAAQAPGSYTDTATLTVTTSP